MNLIFKILKEHEGHNITCMKKDNDYVVVCKTCKKNILIFGELELNKCYDDCLECEFNYDNECELKLIASEEINNK